MLKLAEMCRKLETEEEKVLPFFASSLSPEEDERLASAATEPPSEALATVVIHQPACELLLICYFPGDARVFLIAKLLETLQQSSVGQAVTRQRKTNPRR